MLLLLADILDRLKPGKPSVPAALRAPVAAGDFAVDPTR
jgi:hypothetical protein